MRILDERERGFESRFAHDEEERFRINARRNRMMGMWAAERLGLSAEEARAYAAEIVTAGMASGAAGGALAVTNRITVDLEAAGRSATSDEIAARMTEFLVTAQRSLNS